MNQNQYFQTTNLHIDLLFNGSLMDDKREGRPSFKTSDVVKNEVCDVIDEQVHYIKDNRT